MAYETEPPHTSSCLRGKRIVLIGDSTSRYEYAQLALSLLGADSAQMSPNPLDVSVFYRIPPRGNESTLMPEWARSTLKSPGCPAYETQSKWASIMRYLHGMIGDLEICDCSPGPTLCCRERFENRVFRFSDRGNDAGSLAYFNLYGDQVPVRGSLGLHHIAAFATDGSRPTHEQFPCPVGVARNSTWEYPVDKLLNRLHILRPTHLVLNMGLWVFDEHENAWWHAIASAGRRLQHRFGTTLLWRTHPRPVAEFASPSAPLPVGINSSITRGVSDIFLKASHITLPNPKHSSNVFLIHTLRASNVFLCTPCVRWHGQVPTTHST